MNTRNAKLIAGAIACGVIGAAVNSVYVADTAHARGASEATASSVAYAAGEDDQQRIVDAVRHTEPSVVALEVSQNGNMVVPNDPFAHFSATVSATVSAGCPAATGSFRTISVRRARGFVYSPSGLIVTNDHVVHGASAITVIFANGDHVPGHIYSENRGADVALVKVDNYKKLPPALQFANSRDVQQGAVGDRRRRTIRAQRDGHGRASYRASTATSRSPTTGQPVEFHNLLQTSAPINPGNSGAAARRSRRPRDRYQSVGRDRRRKGSVSQYRATPRALRSGCSNATPERRIPSRVAGLSASSYKRSTRVRKTRSATKGKASSSKA